MKFRMRSSAPTKFEIPMAPMIDVMFQLLVFFMLNLRLFSPDANHQIHMPIGAPTVVMSERSISEIKVTLRSDRDGNLTEIALGSKNLGKDEAAFERLNREVLSVIGRPGNPLTKDIEVEIDADFETQYKYVVKAISKCTGRYDPSSKQVARYVEKIKFAPPHKPKP